MEILINNSDTNPSYFGVRIKHFEQEENNTPSVDYILTLSITEIVSAYQPFYCDYAEDDLIFREPDEESHILQLRQMKWPPLSCLATNYPMLMQKLLIDTSYDLLVSLYEYPKFGEDARYIANNVENITISSEKIIINGKALTIEKYL